MGKVQVTTISTSIIGVSPPTPLPRTPPCAPQAVDVQVLVVNQANGFMKGVSGLWQSLAGDTALTTVEVNYRNSCGLYLYYRCIRWHQKVF